MLLFTSLLQEVLIRLIWIIRSRLIYIYSYFFGFNCVGFDCYLLYARTCLSVVFCRSNFSRDQRDSKRTVRVCARCYVCYCKQMFPKFTYLPIVVPFLQMKVVSETSSASNIYRSPVCIMLAIVRPSWNFIVVPIFVLCWATADVLSYLCLPL